MNDATIKQFLAQENGQAAGKRVHQIPQFILQQIKNSKVDGYLSGAQAMQAWGITRFIGSEEADAYGQGWLKMKVEGGSQFKGGWARVALVGDGTYTITLESSDNRTGESNALARVERVPVENIALALDQMIEGPYQS